MLTAAFMTIITLQVVIEKLAKGSVGRVLFISWCLVIPLGSLTLFLRDPIFLQWKFSIFHWFLGLALLGSQIIKGPFLIKKMLISVMPQLDEVPISAWNNVTYFISLALLIIGTINLYFIYFSDSTDFQFELFMDALLLSQRQKTDNEKDIIWVSTLGNKTGKDRFIRKPAFALLPQRKSQNVNDVVGPMDFPATVVEEWLNCDIASSSHSNGTNITKVKKDRIMANTAAEGIIVYSKDKAVLIDQNGNFQSYSQQLETPIVINADFPLMIDGVHFIRQFATMNKLDGKAVDNSANDN